MQVGIAGLGRMGAGMARRLARAGHDVAVWNRTEQVAVDLAAEPENNGRIAVAEPITVLPERLDGPRHVIISVPAGKATDDLVNQLADILSPGDVIVDAGSHSSAPLTSRRAAWSGWTWASPAAYGG